MATYLTDSYFKPEADTLERTPFKDDALFAAAFLLENPETAFQRLGARIAYRDIEKYLPKGRTATISLTHHSATARLT